MAVKLRSTLRQIPWSLLGKTALLVGLWYVSAFTWALGVVFLGFALFFYFSSAFESFRLLPLFLIALFLMFLFEPGFFPLLLFGVILFLILGIKEPHFIDHVSVYETVVLFLLCAASLRFFLAFDNWQPLYSLLGGALLGGLFFVGGTLSIRFKDTGADAAFWKSRMFLSFGLGGLLLWQMTIVSLFLPLTPYYRVGLVLLLSALLFELLSSHVQGILTREKILVNFTLFFLFAVFILVHTEWTLF